MSTSQTHKNDYQPITPPLSFMDPPLTPPPPDGKTFTQAPRVLKLFKDRAAGRSIKQHPWTEFQLAPGEYEEILHQVSRDAFLDWYVQEKIRYNYDAGDHLLIIRMPKSVHELFLASVDSAIESELKLIRDGSDKAALFAQNVRQARSSEIFFPVDDAPPSTRSKHEPDASFWHKDALYPGVIVEVSYSHKTNPKIARLAEGYLLDSDASVQVVVGLDIEYGKKRSRKATLSVWRTRTYDTVDGKELRVFQEVADEAFRDDQGNPTSHPGLRLQLRDFAHEKLAQDQIGDQHRELAVSTQQLCQYLNDAEICIENGESFSKNSIPPGVKKRKRSITPPEKINSDDEAKHVEQEQRVDKRMEDDDPDYHHSSISSTSSH